MTVSKVAEIEPPASPSGAHEHARHWRVFVTVAVCAMVFVFCWTLAFGDPTIGFDGWQYLSSAKAIATGTMPEHYFWVRTPGYPLFVMSGLGSLGLWLTYILQGALYSLAWAYLAVEMRHTIASGITARRYWMWQSIVFVVMWIYIGGFVMVLLQQSLMISLVAVTAGFTIHSCASLTEPPSQHHRTVTLSLVVWPALAIAAYLLTPLLAVSVLSGWALFAVGTFRLWRKRNSPQLTSRWSVKPIMTVAISGAVMLIVLAIVHIGWSATVSNASQLPNFNAENREDPFWAGSSFAGIYSRIQTRDTYYAQEIAVSATSLLDITQSRGWRGIITNEYRGDERNIMPVFGSEPWTDAGQRCLEDTVASTPILTVDPVFVQDERSNAACPLTDWSIPRALVFPAWLTWMLLLGLTLVSITRRPTLLQLAALAPSVGLIAVYAFAGGAISRYGAPAYLPIAVLGATIIATFSHRRVRV